MTIASVDIELRIFDLLQRVEALADNLVEERCHRKVAFYHHDEVSDGEQRFHVNIIDVERTVINRYQDINKIMSLWLR